MKVRKASQMHILSSISTLSNNKFYNVIRKAIKEVNTRNHMGILLAVSVNGIE